MVLLRAVKDVYYRHLFQKTNLFYCSYYSQERTILPVAAFVQCLWLTIEQWRVSFLD